VSEYSAEEYRRWAAECLYMAATATKAEKSTWLELAGKWQRLAEEAERNHVAQQAHQPHSEENS
jgi:hypothetical protein